jgi:hypothetical protein
MDKQGTLYTEMHDVDGNEYVKAYHMCPSSKADDIKTCNTAGGVSPPNRIGEAPTEAECIKQVEFERAPWAKPTPSAPRVVVEFGVGEPPEYNGGPGYVCAVFEIQAKFLRWGSSSEGGWCAYPNIPIRWVGVGREK